MNETSEGSLYFYRYVFESDVGPRGHRLDVVGELEAVCSHLLELPFGGNEFSLFPGDVVTLVLAFLLGLVVIPAMVSVSESLVLVKNQT